MFLNALKLRLMFLAMGLVALGVWVAAGGRLGPSDRGAIVIEYGTYPEGFEGLTVAIDGEPAGVLRSVGAQTRTAFAVKEGAHRVAVVGANFACPSREVEVKSGGTVMLVLDFGGTMSGSNPSGKAPLILN